MTKWQWRRLFILPLSTPLVMQGRKHARVWITWPPDFHMTFQIQETFVPTIGMDGVE